MTSATRTLQVLRHAKSDWSEAGMPDSERPLNARGQRAAHLVGVFLVQQEIVPDAVLCSTSRRTRETLHAIERELPGPPPPVEWLEELYLATPGTLLDCVSRAPASARTLMIVAHAPGVEELTRALAGRALPKAADAFARGFATAALAEIDFDAPDWRSIAPGDGTLRRFTRPKELV